MLECKTFVDLYLSIYNSIKFSILQAIYEFAMKFSS